MKILHHLPPQITNIVTDSRRITPSLIQSDNTAFVALRTAIGDGHHYISELYSKGLRYFIVDKIFQKYYLDDAVFIVVEGGTLDFLIRTAGERLEMSNIRQIVVTGSNRKTTVKEIITKALRESGKTVARSPRTWNSAMGTALSLFDNIAKNPEWIITEVGIDAPGQSRRLAPMLKPKIGIITGITDEHDDAFESHAAKIAEKVALVADAESIFYVGGDDELERQIKATGHPYAIKVKDIKELVEAVTGRPCPTTHISTRIDVRQAPNNCILFIDSFTNDLDSLPLSLDLAAQRQGNRKLNVYLADFEGDRKEAKRLVEERGGSVYFGSKDDRVDTYFYRRNDVHDTLILIKGGWEKAVTYFDEARHNTTLEVDLEAIVHNYNSYRHQLPPHTGIIAMVKADAYGMGALEVAKTLQAHGATYLAVAVVDEGVALREAGIKMPIIVLNPITNRFDALIDYRLEPAVFSLEELERLENGLSKVEIFIPAVGENYKTPVHIKLDTGMHRVGFTENEIDTLAKHIKESRIVRPASIFSHLATADCPDMTDYTVEQVRRFEDMSCRLAKSYGEDMKRHLLNTAGIETLGKTPAAYDMARLGIGLYGVSPLKDSSLNLRPVARLVSTIISLKHWPEGTSIGYARRGMTKRPSVVATLPIGYADGIDRRLGNGNARFVVEGVECPTIGNICMDLLMLDVTDAVNAGKDIKVGTEVEIFGPSMPIERISDFLGTIPYEVLTSVSPRVRRTYRQR